MIFSLSPFAPDNLVSRDRFGRPVPRQTAHLHTNLVLAHGIPPAFRGGVHLFIPPYVTGSVPSLSGHAIAYRWRSLPRVRRYTASSPQGSSSSCLKKNLNAPRPSEHPPVRGKKLLPLQVTMNQLMCASLFPHPLLV